MIDYIDGIIYQKKGMWKYQGSAKKFATREEAAAAAAADGFAVQTARVQQPIVEESSQSPLEMLRGIQICDVCNFHPCECQWKSPEKTSSPTES